jgi:hypothetical protein
MSDFNYSLEELPLLILQKETEMVVIRIKLSELQRKELYLRMIVEDEIVHAPKDAGYTNEEKRRCAIYFRLDDNDEYNEVISKIAETELNLNMAKVQLNYLKNSFEMLKLTHVN